MLALGAGTSLALSVVIVIQSVSSSMGSFSVAVAGGAQLKVIGSTPQGGITRSIVSRIRSTRGVASATAVVQAVTLLQSPHSKPIVVVALGISCTPGTRASTEGCPALPIAVNRMLAGPDQTALVAPTLLKRAGVDSINAHPGNALQLRTDAGPVPLTTLRQVSALDRINSGRLIVLALKTSQRLFDRGNRVDAVYVRAKRGVNVANLQTRLQHAVGGWNGVVSSADPPPEVGIASNAIIPLLLVVSVLASGIAAVLVYNIVSLSLEERRKENAILAALGASGGAIALGPLSEAALLGATGGALGSLGGWLMAQPVASTLSNFTKTLVGVPVIIHLTPVIFAAGIGLGTGLALLAALRPIRRAARADVAAELQGRERRLETSALVLSKWAAAGLALSGIGLAGCWLGQYRGALQPWQPALADISFFMTVISSVLATASITPLVAIGARKLGIARGSLAGMGIANLAREPGRTGVMAVAIAASVSTAFITASFNSSIYAGLSASLSGGGARGVFVATTARNSSATVDAKLPTAAVQRLARVPGVATVNPQITILSGHSSGHLIEVEASAHPLLNLPLYAGHESLSRFNNGQVLVGAAVARRLHLSPGSLLRLDTPHGYAYLPVQGIWGDGTLVGENVTVPMATVTRLWGPQLPAVVGLTPQPTVTSAQLARNVRAANVLPGLQVLTATQVLSLASSIAAAQLAPFWALQHALILVAFIAVLSTMLLVGIERQKEMAMLTAVGMSPAGLFTMVTSEAGGVGLIGATLGVALGFPGMLALIEITPIFIGYANPLRFDIATLAVYVPVVVAVSVFAATLPAWRAVHLNVISTLQYE
ncbi:MAG: ABC transporter permease [Acidimicrobiales bacterium]